MTFFRAALEGIFTPMKPGRVLIASLGVAAALAGCAGHRHSDAAPGGQLYSPNGEVLNGGPLGRPSCTEAMTAWFERTDANHDGAIVLAEFLNDARRQFAVMDLNKDGTITPDELQRYREPYRFSGKVASDRTADQDSLPSSAESGHRAGRRNGGAGSSAGGGRQAGNMGTSGSDVADPVMLADSTLRMQVSAADWLAHAQRAFAELNLAHDGRLTHDEVLRSCREK
jgi:hypothetical protein